MLENEMFEFMLSCLFFISYNSIYIQKLMLFSFVYKYFTDSKFEAKLMKKL